MPLKRKITYEDLDGNTVTDVFEFNLTHKELIAMNAKPGGGMGGLFQRLIDQGDEAGAWTSFDELILSAYGQRSDDGKRFIKNEETRAFFRDHLAFDALILEFLEREEAALEWLKGVVPKDMAQGVTLEVVKEAIAKGDVTTALPPPPKG
jgi:hypothetical protein